MLEEYGKWLVLYNEKVILSGDNIGELLEEAEKKYPRRKLAIAKTFPPGNII